MSQVLTQEETYSIAERLERLPLTRYQIKLFFILGTAFLFDCIDIAMMTFALAPIKAEFKLDTTQTGLLGSMTFVGMFIGASSAGLLADRFGRLKIFQLSMIIWGIASLFCGLAPDLNILMACRVLLGIGMAMEPVAGLALLSEFIPAKQRGKYITYLEGIWPIGFVFAGLFAYFLVPIAGWRSLFIAQAIPAIFVFFVRRDLPESPRWLESKGNQIAADKIMSIFEYNVQKALGGAKLPLPKKFLNNQTVGKRSGFLELFRTGLARRTIMIWSLWFFGLLGYYGLTTWFGVLLTAKGYAMTKSSLYIAMISTAGIPGFIVVSKLVEKWGRKPTVIFTLLGSAIAVYLYGNANNFTELILFGLVMQFFMYGIWCSVYPYTPELYPTHLRATGAGFASALGRLGALFGPFIVGLILPLFGQSGVFQSGAAAFVIAAITTFILGEETKGKTLEEINAF